MKELTLDKILDNLTKKVGTSVKTSGDWAPLTSAFLPLTVNV